MERKKIILIIVMLVVLLVAAVFGGYYIKKQREPKPSFSQIICLAEVTQDVNYCNEIDIRNASRELCVQSVYHADLLINNNLSVIDKLTLMKSRFEAIAYNSIEKCNGEISCEAIVAKDPDRCGNDKGCLDIYNLITAVKEKDMGYCDKMADRAGRTQCIAILSKNPELCKEV